MRPPLGVASELLLSGLGDSTTSTTTISHALLANSGAQTLLNAALSVPLEVFDPHTHTHTNTHVYAGMGGKRSGAAEVACMAAEVLQMLMGAGMIGLW